LTEELIAMYCKSPVVAALVLVGLVAPSASSKRKSALKSSVPLEELIQYNAEKLFGSGKVTIEGDRVTVFLDKDGHLYSTFEGRGLKDSTHADMQGANRRFIQYGKKDGKGKKDEEEKLLPGLVGIGMDGGLWVSRFPLAGETRLQFDIRIPNILTRQSVLRVYINFKGKPVFETSFFNSISKSGRRRMTQYRDYQAHASKWFPRKGEPVPVEFGIADGQCVVKFNGQEMVACPSGKETGGKVAFLYSKLLFTVQNLKISGKLDLDWCDETLAELEKKGELLEAPPEPPEKKEGETSGEGPTKEGEGEK
jgi:hypothetical protein